MWSWEIITVILQRDPESLGKSRGLWELRKRASLRRGNQKSLMRGPVKGGEAFSFLFCNFLSRDQVACGISTTQPGGLKLRPLQAVGLRCLHQRDHQGGLRTQVSAYGLALLPGDCMFPVSLARRGPRAGERGAHHKPSASCVKRHSGRRSRAPAVVRGS